LGICVPRVCLSCYVDVTITGIRETWRVSGIPCRMVNRTGPSWTTWRSGRSAGGRRQTRKLRPLHADARLPSATCDCMRSSIDHRPACACGNSDRGGYWHQFSNFSFIATMITLFERQTMQGRGSAGLLSWRISLLLVCFSGKNSAYMVLVLVVAI
jgi:hypothetical protein